MFSPKNLNFQKTRVLLFFRFSDPLKRILAMKFGYIDKIILLRILCGIVEFCKSKIVGMEP